MQASMSPIARRVLFGAADDTFPAAKTQAPPMSELVVNVLHTVSSVIKSLINNHTRSLLRCDHWKPDEAAHPQAIAHSH